MKITRKLSRAIKINSILYQKDLLLTEWAEFDHPAALTSSIFLMCAYKNL